MASRVVIVEDSTAGRMLIGSLLSAGHYEVVTMGSGDLPVDALDEVPSLMMIGPSVDRSELLVQRIKARADLRHVPILVLSRDMAPARRLNMMVAGARDVLDYPLNEFHLLARIRSLLREAEAYREIERRRLAALRFGFAETPSVFAGRKRLTVVRDRNAPLPFPDCGDASSWSLETADPAAALSPDDGAALTDGYILDWRETRPGAAVRLALPELRSRLHSRHAAILILHDAPDFEAAVNALDLGATDVIADTAEPSEVAYRISRMLKRKVAEDALRRTAEDSLQLAMTDSLTGLYNRRYAEAYLADLLEEGASERGFAVMIADIDHFKAINDTHGHAAGDEVLCKVAARLREELRSIDLVARYGGEEFLIVLAESALSQAKMAANRLRARIGDVPVTLSSGLRIDVTVSIGLSMGDDQVLTRMCGTFGETAQGSSRRIMSDLLGRADSALYRAKAMGRNRVQFEVNPA